MCHFGTPQTLTRSEISAKSNHSRTSKKFSRKSNYSRTYAKTGGGALLLDFQLGILRRMPILSAPAAAGESKDLSRHSPLATRHSPLSPIIPAHTNHSPVSPIIPALTQNIGGGGRSLNGNVPKICRRADILFPARGERQPKNRSREVRDRPLHTLDGGDLVLASATTTAWTGCRNRWRRA